MAKSSKRRVEFYASPVTPEQDYLAELSFSLEGIREEIFFDIDNLASSSEKEDGQLQVDKHEGGIGSFTAQHYLNEIEFLKKALEEA